MDITIATRLSRVEESATLKMAQATRAVMAQGHKVINFSIGEPCFPVPMKVQEAAIQAVKGNKSRYTPVPGILELREKIAKKLREENGLNYTPDQIVVSLGAKQAIYNFLMATLNPGDEVIIPSPYWTSYPEMVKLAEGNPVIIQTEEKNDFKISPSQLKAHITSKTRAVFFNSPSNPTGSVYSREELKALAEVLKGTNILVCSDEIYEKLLLGDKTFTSFGSLSEDAFQRTVTINGFSKSHAMTGWRLGYAAGPTKIIKAMILIQGQSTSGANSVAQYAALAGLDMKPEEYKAIVDELKKCRSLMAACFSDCNLVSFSLPEGAFYFFLNIGKVLGKTTPEGKKITNSEDLSLCLLEKGHVSTVSGSGFGNDNYLRLSFSASEAEIQEGCKRVIQTLQLLK